MKKKRNILKWALCCGAAAALCMAVWYQFGYPIRLNWLTLPHYIEAYYMRGRQSGQAPDIELYTGVELGSRAYYLIELDGDLGYVALERGLTGRYRIVRLGYGGGNFLPGVVEAQGKKYLLFGGRDPAKEIAEIAVTLEGLTYTLEVDPKDDHFLLCTEVDGRIAPAPPDLDRILFRNHRGEEITAQYDLSSGGIGG